MPYPHLTKLSGANTAFIAGNSGSVYQVPTAAIDTTAGLTVTTGSWPVTLVNTAPVDNGSYRWKKTNNGLDLDSQYYSFMGCLVTNGDNYEKPVGRHVHGTIVIQDSVIAFPFISTLVSSTPSVSSSKSMNVPQFLPVEQSLGSSGGGYHYVTVNVTIYRHVFDNQVADNYISDSPLVIGWALYNRSSNDKTNVILQQAHIEVLKYDRQYNIFEPVR